MPQWGVSNTTSNAVLWAPAQFNLAPNSANRDLLFGNTTASGVRTGETIGLYPVTANLVANNLGSIMGVDVLSPGTGATARPTVTFTDPTGGGSSATATTNTMLVSAAVNSTTTGTNGNYIPTANATTTLKVSATGNSFPAVLNVVSTAVRGTPIVNAAGGLYTNGDVVTTATGTGTKATFTVTTNGTGNAATVAVTTRGGYLTNPTNLTANATTSLVTSVNASANGLTLCISGNSTLGMGVNAVTISNAGSFVGTLPVSNAAVSTNTADQTGTGATFVVGIGLERIVVTGAGSGYSDTTAVTFNNNLTGQSVSVQTPKGGSFAHQGWNLITQGTGGRAGRTQTECLVVGHIAGDTTLPGQ